MSYYVSQYLNIYPSYRGHSILFHGVTGAIDEVDKRLGKRLQKTRHTRLPVGDIANESTIEYLLKRGYLTKFNKDEEVREFCGYVTGIYDHARNQNQKKSAGLLLMPSYDCNLKCPYCFQCGVRPHNSKTVMSLEMVDAIFKKGIKKLFSKVDRFSQVKVTLYGGEPLLFKHGPVIHKVIDYTKHYQMEVGAITNGTNVKHYLKLFGNEPGFINSVQISLDGDKKYHDQTRVSHPGHKTFDTIIENVHRLIDKNVKVILRINTSVTNQESLITLKERLDKEELLYHPLMYVYPAAVHEFSADFLDRKYYLTPASLTNYIQKKQLPFKSPFHSAENTIWSLLSGDKTNVLNRITFCMHSAEQAYVVDPMGRLFGCYEEVGSDEMSIGSLNCNGQVTLNERHKVYQSRHVGMYDPCRQCSIALLCGGGCPHMASGKDKSAGAIFKGSCYSYKEGVAKLVQQLYERRMLNINQNQPAKTIEGIGVC